MSRWRGNSAALALAAFSVVLLAAVWGLAQLRRQAAALPFRDSFAARGLEGWQPMGGEWSSFDHTAMNDSDERGAKLLAGSDRWRDYSFSADVRLFRADGDAGLIVRSSDEQLGSNSYSGYYAGLRSHDGRLVLGSANYGWLESQTTPFPGGVKARHWYHLELAAVGCTVAAVAVDLQTGVRSSVSTAGQPCLPQGRVGLRSYATGGQWRNLLVRPMDAAGLAALHATRQPQQPLTLPSFAQAEPVPALPLPPSPSAPRAAAAAIGSLRYAGSVDPQPVTIRGTVILRRPTLVIQDATGGIAIPAQDPIRFALGDEVQATGIPQTHGFGLQLDSASVQVLGAGNPPPPRSVTAADAATGVYDGQFIELTGLVVQTDSKRGASGEPDSLLLESGSQLFRAKLPQQAYGLHPAHLSRHSLVRLRGVEAVDPRLTANQVPFVLFLPSPTSMELLANPPWWSLQHMVWLVPIFIIGLLLLQLLRVHEHHLRVRAALDERQRLGSEIHDTLAQSFAGIGYQLRAVRSQLAAGSAGADQHLALAMDMVRHSQEEARRSIAAMQLEAVEGKVLAAALEARARRMVDGTSLHITASTAGEPQQLSPRLTDMLFRVGQEAIANSIRHASPARLSILISFESGMVRMVIDDDGYGFDAGTEQAGFGLRSMRRRAAAVGAELLVTSTPGAGARVELRASLRREPAFPQRLWKRQLRRQLQETA